MSSIPEGSIVITPVEVYNEVKSLTDEVRKLVAAQAADPTPSAVADHEQRIRRLERALWIGVGIAAAAGSAVGSAASSLLG